MLVVELKPARKVRIIIAVGLLKLFGLLEVDLN